MVLEELAGVKAIRKHPLIMLFWAVVLASEAMFLSYYTFPNSASILSLAFVTISLMPIITRLFFEIETEECDERGWSFAFLARHFDVIQILTWFFVGLVVAYCAWYVVLPAQHPAYCSTTTGFSFECFVPERNALFSEQESTWKIITDWSTIGQVTGPRACLGASPDFAGCTGFIFTNNAIVLALAILFSFMYSAGAILLLSWNASVIATFIGRTITETNISGGLSRAISYLPHGIPEVSGYFIGAIAGGIISFALIKKKHRTHEFSRIAKDAIFMLIIAYGLLLLGALIEAYLILGGG